MVLLADVLQVLIQLVLREVQLLTQRLNHVALPAGGDVLLVELAIELGLHFRVPKIQVLHLLIQRFDLQLLNLNNCLGLLYLCV